MIIKGKHPVDTGTYSKLIALVGAADSVTATYTAALNDPNAQHVWHSGAR